MHNPNVKDIFWFITMQKVKKTAYLSLKLTKIGSRGFCVFYEVKIE
jgi:hypothetical protein